MDYARCGDVFLQAKLRARRLVLGADVILTAILMYGSYAFFRELAVFLAISLFMLAALAILAYYSARSFNDLRKAVDSLCKTCREVYDMTGHSIGCALPEGAFICHNLHNGRTYIYSFCEETGALKYSLLSAVNYSCVRFEGGRFSAEEGVSVYVGAISGFTRKREAVQGPGVVLIVDSPDKAPQALERLARGRENLCRAIAQGSPENPTGSKDFGLR